MPLRNAFNELGLDTTLQAIRDRLPAALNGGKLDTTATVTGSVNSSVADGADVAQGTTSDASTANTVIGLLKAIKAAIQGTLTVAGSLGRSWTLSSGSDSISASVSNFPATQPVSGPLTDTELRATAVPTSLASVPTHGVTIADGADVAQGTTTDLSSANTIVGLLKAIKAALQSTLTIGGTVTANAGTNLNTSTLALETGGNLASIKTNTDNLSGVKTDLDTLAGAVSSGAIAVQSGGSTGATAPTRAIQQGVLAKTALPTAVTDGQLVAALSDKFGRDVVLPNAIRDIVGSQTTTISASVVETTIVTAASNIFNDIFAIWFSNTSSTATRVDIRDTTGGSIIFQMFIPGNEVRGISVTTPLPQTSVTTNWTAQCGTSVTDLRVTAWFIKNK